MSNGALRYEDSPCGIGLTSIIDLDQISDFSQEAKSIAYLQRKLNVTTREPFERDTPAHNFAISYTGSTHKFTEYGPARELLYLLVHAARAVGAERVRLWYDKIYCLGVSWHERVKTGWISHGLDPYLKYPVLGMGGKESTSDYDRMWIISEHSAARLGAGIFYSEGFWEAGFEQGSGDRTWNCRKGKDLARAILAKPEGKLSFGLSGIVPEKNAFIDLMSRYASRGDTFGCNTDGHDPRAAGQIMDDALFTQSADLADSVSDIGVTAEDVKEALVELGATVTDGRLVDLVCGKSSGQLASMHLSGGITYLVSKGFISHSAGGTAVSTILAGGQARAQELTSERCSRTVNVSGVIELLRQLETNDQTVFHWASKSLYEGSASVLIELTECGGPEVDERSREHLMSVRDEVRNAEEFGYEMSIGDVATATIMLVLKKNGRDRLRRAVFDIAGRYNGAEASPYYRQTLGHTLTENRHYYGVIRAATRDKIDTPLPAKVTSTKNVEWKGEDLYEFRYGNLSVILALAVGLVLTGVVASMVNWQSDEGNRADSISAVLAAVAVLMGLVPYLVSEVSSRRSDKRMMLRGYRLVEGSTLQGDMRIHAISAAIRAGKGQHFTSQWCCLIPEHTGGRYTLDTPLTLKEWIDVGAEVVTGNTPELFIKLAGVTYALGRGSGAAMHGYVVAGRIEGVEKARVSSEGRSVSVGYTPPGRYTERRKDT